MPFDFISERDFCTRPEQYAQYLRDTASNAKRILGLPVQQWPRGTSHEVSRAILAECDEAYCDLVLDFGEFTAYGKLAGFAEV